MFIGRLDHQKGVDLLLESAPWILDQGCQLVMLGSGRADLEQGLRSLEASRHDAARCWVGFDVPFAHRLTAGADVCVMPSRFEPCGLQVKGGKGGKGREGGRRWCAVLIEIDFNHQKKTPQTNHSPPPSFLSPQQMSSQRYGTPVVAHATGGLRTTVLPHDPETDRGTGWLFDRYDGEGLRTALHHAITTYRDWRPSFHAIARRGMETDWSWTAAAERYERELIAAKYSW